MHSFSSHVLPIFRLQKSHFWHLEFLITPTNEASIPTTEKGPVGNLVSLLNRKITPIYNLEMHFFRFVRQTTTFGFREWFWNNLQKKNISEKMKLKLDL